MTFDEIVSWLREERNYQASKFDYEEQADPNYASQAAADYWESQVGMYLHRAKTLGYDTPVGLQAMMKALATAMGMAEAVTEGWGAPPPPGRPSGEVE